MLKALIIVSVVSSAIKEMLMTIYIPTRTIKPKIRRTTPNLVTPRPEHKLVDD